MSGVFLLIVYLAANSFDTVCSDLGSQQGPVFIFEPSDKVEFLNTRGTSVDCSAHGEPVPRVVWKSKDGAPVTEVPELRLLPKNGSLVLLPMKSEQYRQNVHANVYHCQASNIHGLIVSRPVHVRAVVAQEYQVQVYDEYVIVGTTGVIRCHIPSFLKDYVSVVGWIRDDNKIIKSASSSTGDRYSIMANGNLYIRDVRPSDGQRSYWCQAKHKLSGESKVSNTRGRLIVSEPRSSVPPRITERTVEFWAKGGTNIELPCAAQGYPAPQYRWLFKNLNKSGFNELKPDSQIYQLPGSLLLKHITGNKAGTYVCRVNNSVGYDSVQIELLVSEPFVAYIDPQHQIVDSGQSANFTCTFSGAPLKTLKWLHNGRVYKRIELKTSMRQHTLRIPFVSRDKTGMYQCFVGNDHRAGQGTAQLLLGDAAPSFQSVFRTTVKQPGSSILLKCEVSGSPMPRIQWTLDETIITDNKRYDISYRNDQLGKIISILNLNGITTKDSGLYSCRATNAVGVVSHVRRVNVYGPPSIGRMKNITTISGEDVRMTCNYKGYPIDSIGWNFDGTTIKDSSRYIQSNNGTLRIKNVQKSRDDGRYTCLVKSHHGNVVRGHLWLRVLVKPVIKKMSENVVESGDRLSIMCTVTRGDPPIYKRWLKDGEELPHDLGITVTDTQDFSVIHIPSVQSIHQGNYTCIASNDAGRTNSTTSVNVRSPPIWHRPPSDTVVGLNTSAALNCKVSGYPVPTVTWTHDKSKSKAWSGNRSEDRHRVLGNGSLIIDGIMIQDGGLYTCTVRNDITSQGSSKSARLTVGNSPVVTSEKKYFQVRKAASLTLRCDLRSGSKASVKWAKDSFDINDSRFAVETLRNGVDSYVHTLRLDRVESTDGGQYSCTGENRFGKRATTFHVKVIERPHRPSNLRLKRISEQMVRLSWKVPKDGNRPIIRYTVHSKTSSEPWSKSNETNLPSVVTSYVFKYLKKNTKYESRVTAVNVLGQGQPSPKITFHLTSNGSLVINTANQSLVSTSKSKVAKVPVIIIAVTASCTSAVIIVVTLTSLIIIRKKRRRQTENAGKSMEQNSSNKEMEKRREESYVTNYGKLNVDDDVSSDLYADDKIRRRSLNGNNECFYDDISPYATFNLNQRSTNTGVELKSFKT